MTSPSTTTIPNKYSISILLVLIVAGLAGNYFRYPIFLNIDFLFGSIFAMLALQFFGLGRGILAAAFIAGYTYILWNHPYAIIIMTAEVAAVGWLMGRRKMGMVLADALYWLVIGMPLVYLFYHVIMETSVSNTMIVMTKQAVNGIANTLVARLIFTGIALRSRTSLTSYHEIVYNLLAFFVLCPTLIMLATNSRTDFAETDRHIRTTLIQDSLRITNSIETWLLNRKSAIVNLAEMAPSKSPQQMQPYLELVKKSDVNFLRVGLLDREAIITAYFPVLDELGRSSIGISAADRPYLPILKRTLKPMLSDVVMGRVGIPKPRVFMLAPVVIQREFGGYAIGVLELEQIRESLEKSTSESTSFYTLLDKNGNIIMTNHPDQTVMKPLVHGKGTLNRLDNKISQWVPTLPPNTPISERWKKSHYITESTIGDLAEWKLVLEQRVAPYQKTLYDEYTGKLTLLFLILLLTLALAEFLSRRIVATLGQLHTLTHELPVKLATDGKDIAWPESGILEANQLISNFREMADSLSEKFIENREINESLEHRVEERTEELHESQRFLSELIENIGAAIYAKDREGRYELVNRKWEEATGLKRESSIGKTDEELLPGATGREFRKHDLQTMESGSVLETEEIIEDAAGKRFFLSIKIPIRNSNNAVRGICGISTDITDRKQAEAALKESEDKFHTLFDYTSEAVMLMNENSFIDCNKATLNLFGCATHTEFCTMRPADLSPPKQPCGSDSLSLSNRNIATATENGSYRFEWVHRRADNGKDFLAEVLLSAMQIDGKAHIQATVHDITERKQAEATLRRLASEQSIILDNAGVGITFVQNRQFKWTNTAMCQMFGYTPEEITDASTRIIYPSQEDYEQTGQEAYSVLATGRTYTKELLLRRSDGSMFHALYNGRVINPADPIAGSIWIISDETERYELQTKLLDARDAAESANRAKSEFLANMSHEIRTPMNGLLGMTQLLEMTELTQEQREYVAALKLSGKNLLSLISDILDLSKIEAGKITVELSEFSPKICINDIVIMQKQVIHEKGLKLDVDIAGDIPHILIGDQLRIKQIILNLLGNAVKFTTQGTISIKAQLLEQHGDSVLIQIAVQDTGAGITHDAFDKIFMPFIQEDGSTTRRYGGTGLGLTISRRLAELLGGTISVESTPGVGSCFTLTLPFTVGTGTVITQDAVPTATIDWEGPPPRILYVEDDQINITYGTSLLRKLGHDFIAVKNGKECLQALEQGKFDLVLMDINMPVMNGEEALLEIRRKEQETGLHLPVIAVTAHAMRGDKEHFLKEGFDGYVSKPLTTRELVNEMKRVLG